MNNEKITMQNLPLNDRPYEKFIMSGGQSLSETELLAVLLGSGYKGATALDLARKVLSEERNLKNVARLSCEELQQYHGIGQVKAIRILSAFELGRRVNFEQQTELNPEIRSSDDGIKLMEQDLLGLDREEFHVLFLNIKGRLIKKVKLSTGGLSNASIYPRDIFREALKANAAAMILCHNHPSGDSTPSSADIHSTKVLQEFGTKMGIQVLDHIIIADEGSISMRGLGLLA